ALQSKHARHTDRYRCHVLSTPDLGSAPLHLDDTGERFGDVLRYEFDLDDLAVAVVRGGASKSLLHLLPTAYVRTKRVSEGHVFCRRIQRLVEARVTSEDRAEGRVTLFDRVNEVACRHLVISLQDSALPSAPTSLLK